jgi:hypothetical protein
MPMIHEASNLENTVIQERERLSSKSTSGKTAQMPFGDEARKKVAIPKIFDDCNLHINGMD